MSEVGPGERIDKWLWYTRFVKTRSLAKKLVETGKLRVDGEKTTNASRKLRIGNVLTLTRERDIVIIEVTGMPKRRGPFVEAQTFYNDLTPAKPETDASQSFGGNKPFEERTGRPTKQQRRKIIALKHSSLSQDD